jgi:RNA processing factor Prp31
MNKKVRSSLRYLDLSSIEINLTRDEINQVIKRLGNLRRMNSVSRNIVVGDGQVVITVNLIPNVKPSINSEDPLIRKHRHIFDNELDCIWKGCDVKKPIKTYEKREEVLQDIVQAKNEGSIEKFSEYYREAMKEWTNKSLIDIKQGGTTKPIELHTSKAIFDMYGTCSECKDYCSKLYNGLCCGCDPIYKGWANWCEECQKLAFG